MSLVCAEELPGRLDRLRQEANRCHQQQRYSAAIQLNSRAIRLRPSVPTFYSNRAAAYMKRAWSVVGSGLCGGTICGWTVDLSAGPMFVLWAVVEPQMVYRCVMHKGAIITYSSGLTVYIKPP